MKKPFYCRAMLILLMIFALVPSAALAESDLAFTQAAGSDYLREPYTYRFESMLTYENLTPNSDYGDWRSLDAALYAKVNQRVTAVAQFSHHDRIKEGTGQLAMVGAYVDWLNWLSTYSALSRGFGEDFLPVWRADHDFYFLYDPFVFTLGASYLDYDGPQRDWIVSAGVTWYHNRWIGEYRLFRNTSDPGSLVSYTHLISVGYGEDGWRWLFLKLSIGAQAYQALSLAEPEDVRQDAWEISFEHRHWLGQDWGLLGRAGFLALEDGYDKYGLSIGYFKEF